MNQTVKKDSALELSVLLTGYGTVELHRSMFTALIDMGCHVFWDYDSDSANIFDRKIDFVFHLNLLPLGTEYIDRLRKKLDRQNPDAIIIDMHGEATSEKKAFGYYVDGQVTAVLGTHTHVPTADSVILPKGTAYQTDVGMSGDYNSIIGFDINNPIHGFVKGYRAEGRFTPATANITICGALIEIDINNGLAKNITPIQET